MTGRKTIIIRVHPRITALYPPTLALTARSRGPFHLGMYTLLFQVSLSTEALVFLIQYLQDIFVDISVILTKV